MTVTSFMLQALDGYPLRAMLFPGLIHAASSTSLTPPASLRDFYRCFAEYVR